MSSYLQATSLQPHGVKGPACPPDFLQHGINHLLPEQLVCSEDGGEVREKQLRGHLPQEEVKTKTKIIVLKFNSPALRCVLSSQWKTVVVLHFPLVCCIVYQLERMFSLCQSMYVSGM